jgi:ATPase subunit of ABC transporter with duplicated ATPase domains
MTGEKTSGDFDGTIILISHDRALIDAVCDHILVLDGDGGAEVFPGTYSEWKITQAERSAAKDEPRKQAQLVETPKPIVQQKKIQDAPKSRFSWMPINKIEQRMSDLGIEIRTLDAELGGSDIWNDYEKANTMSEKRDGLQAELDELEMEWLRKSE